MKKLSTIILVLILSLLSIQAQDTIRINLKVPKIIIVNKSNNDIIKHDSLNQIKDFQLSYVYPLSTNGFWAYKYANRFSINILAGLNGGVEGFEAGGIANINNGSVRGFQGAGVFNLNRRSVDGAELAGIFNINGGYTKGTQIAGIFNLNAASANGLQVAGIFNLNAGSFEGLQAAGIFNTNVSLKNEQPKNLVQLSGIFNINTTEFKGFQGSGILNISADSMVGAQIGLINAATYIKGVQIGLINIVAKRSKVLPIGLISIVPNGVHEIEFAAGDLIYANANLKLGVNALYTIFRVGASYGKKPTYSCGIGLGSNIKFSDKAKLSFELTSSNIIDYQTFLFNQLTKFDINFKYNIFKHFAIFAGPSFNNYFFLTNNSENEPLLKPLYSLYSQNYNNFKTYNWIGANLGISINF